MKRSVFYVLMITLLASGCAPSTSITGSWRSPDTTKQYNSIMVAALTANAIARSTMERELASQMGKSINVVKSIDEFPPEISGIDTNKTALMDRIQNKKLDGILTVSLLSQETETRYMRDRDPYSPLNYPYYNSFWGYYTHWYPQVYNQGYYVQNKVYFIETNLYDAKTEKLIWSEQSQTYDPANLEEFSKEFATIITAKLRSDRILPPVPAKDK